MRTCSIRGCKRKHYAKELCKKHYGAAYVDIPGMRVCSNSGCKKKHMAKGLCSGHYWAESGRRAEHDRRGSERLKVDPLFKFKTQLRSLIWAVFKRGGLSKDAKTAQILGCSFEEAMRYVGWFPGCEIHHIVPMETARTKEEVVLLNHHTNLTAVTPERHKEIHTQMRQACPIDLDTPPMI